VVRTTAPAASPSATHDPAPALTGRGGGLRGAVELLRLCGQPACPMPERTWRSTARALLVLWMRSLTASRNEPVFLTGGPRARSHDHVLLGPRRVEPDVRAAGAGRPPCLAAARPRHPLRRGVRLRRARRLAYGGRDRRTAATGGVLADFGADPWVLLECVPNYTNVVASFNAAYAGMLRSYAALLRHQGATPRRSGTASTSASSPPRSTPTSTSGYAARWWRSRLTGCSAETGCARSRPTTRSRRTPTGPTTVPRARSAPGRA